MFAGFGLVLLTAAPTLAQAIWDNGKGDNRWGKAKNWNPNSVPTAISNVQFNATDDNATVSNIQLRANQTANSLTFNNVDDNFSLLNGKGTRTLALTSGGITRTAGSSGTQSLAFTTLALGGNAAMDIAGSGSLTISSGITGTGYSLTKSGAGELILSGANTYSGDTTVTAGTLTLQSASALGTGSTLTLAGGTLRLSTASTTVTNLNLTAHSIIDFSTAATLNITNLNLNGFTLTVQNWANMSDFFYAANWSGAVSDTTGSSPMNLVTFTGFAASDTKWQSYDSQVTPVPEPSTYGAFVLCALTGFFAWRRLRLARIHHSFFSGPDILLDGASTKLSGAIVRHRCLVAGVEFDAHVSVFIPGDQISGDNSSSRGPANLSGRPTRIEGSIGGRLKHTHLETEIQVVGDDERDAGQPYLITTGV
jgi:autotransporter-associated beta strand protein